MTKKRLELQKKTGELLQKQINQQKVGEGGVIYQVIGLVVYPAGCWESVYNCIKCVIHVHVSAVIDLQA